MENGIVFDVLPKFKDGLLYELFKEIHDKSVCLCSESEKYVLVTDCGSYVLNNECELDAFINCLDIYMFDNRNDAYSFCFTDEFVYKMQGYHFKVMRVSDYAEMVIRLVNGIVSLLDDK